MEAKNRYRQLGSSVLLEELQQLRIILKKEIRRGKRGQEIL